MQKEKPRKPINLDEHIGEDVFVVDGKWATKGKSGTLDYFDGDWGREHKVYTAGMYSFSINAATAKKDNDRLLITIL